MAEYIERENVKNLIEVAIEDSWELDYTLDRLKEVNSADVIERSEFEEMVKSFKAMVEIKNENLIAMRDKYYILEKEYAELKVKINKAIEEMERIISDTSYVYTSEGVKLALKILKRNIGE